MNLSPVLSLPPGGCNHLSGRDHISEAHLAAAYITNVTHCGILWGGLHQACPAVAGCWLCRRYAGRKCRGW